MQTYHLIDLDVWGNEDDGFEVNNMRTTGCEIELDPDDDAAILEALIKRGYLAPNATLDMVEIDGADSTLLTISDASNGCPLWQLRVEADKPAIA